MTKTIIFKKFAGEVDLMRSLLTIQLPLNGSNLIIPYTYKFKVLLTKGLYVARSADMYGRQSVNISDIISLVVRTLVQCARGPGFESHLILDLLLPDILRYIDVCFSHFK